MRIFTEAAKIAHTHETLLHIRYLRGYNGNEFGRALDIFLSKDTDVSVKIQQSNHKESFDLLRTDKADLVFNDQRRAFSKEYSNIILNTSESCIEIAARSPITQLGQVTLQDLKNTPCILVSSEVQKNTE
ncbi:MAG TPA: hypothetical protein IAB62_03590 [Candidatus Coprocola pullicola]|nr:hypothetical protein [Candidatus Coprocola pullicola]